jgi:hypothetical protein
MRLPAERGEFCAKGIEVLPTQWHVSGLRNCDSLGLVCSRKRRGVFALSKVRQETG